ncbi:MAG: Gfo/Idh/MocA family oxidoreductase [Deltaproteobacteria bacterium]|nr:Gfo/Idh/MocA family oxidoreductase [Deltaproteobacteria bacterium]
MHVGALDDSTRKRLRRPRTRRDATSGDPVTPPRLGFLGVAWIGRHRMQAIAEHSGAEIVGICDLVAANRDAALSIAPGAKACEHLGQLLELPIDGVVIATPSALHVGHCMAALESGRAVFCQKPLGRNATETQRVVAAARERDLLLGVDLSYRHTAAVEQIRTVLRRGGIGRVFAADLVFHNSYGPEAAWFYDKASAGGGCVIDLGVHLVDLAMWLLQFPAVEHVDSQLFVKGSPLSGDGVEDFASVQLRLAGDIAVRLTCSWRVSAGRDAIIEATFYGTEGGLSMKNVGGSFYDFVGERYVGTRTERLSDPPDQWGGRAAVEWAKRLARSPRFDAEAERLIDVAIVLDMIYRGGSTSWA